ncbi:Uma2 family endonuclease [Baaleninema simplex]|uniref:Uma2 family endonuclease n=1 Tax=Baaleninema simplex TaxID=2862350 RepID=UPI00034B7864|nr:Uma2 family endonuclease [Baaleninema simplex]
MVTPHSTPPKSPPEIVYPDSDGKPMADNTVQFRWISVIYHNLAWWFAENPNVFVAGDLLWYPVEGNNRLSQAPDVMVAFDRPKGDRGSYKQWQENDIAPQVVFEILSPRNTLKEMGRKFLFYNDYGVEEYYIYDPQKNDLSGWLRGEAEVPEMARLDIIEEMNGWVSPRLEIRFEVKDKTMELYRPDGSPFLDYNTVQQRLQQAEQRAETAEQRAETAEQRAETAEQRARQLAARLQELGIDPDALD